MTNLAEAMNDPRAVFGTPEAVVARTDLTVAQKREVLQRWEYDERQIAVAVEEGMSDQEPRLLSRIVQALQAVDEGVEGVAAPRPPTK